AQEVVDAEDLLLGHELRQPGVEGQRALLIRAERLLEDEHRAVRNHLGGRRVARSGGHGRGNGEGEGDLTGQILQQGRPSGVRGPRSAASAVIWGGGASHAAAATDGGTAK